MLRPVWLRLGDTGDDWMHSLGYLACLPAAYVGVNRAESGHHLPTPVLL